MLWKVLQVLETVLGLVTGLGKGQTLCSCHAVPLYSIFCANLKLKLRFPKSLSYYLYYLRGVTEDAGFLVAAVGVWHLLSEYLSMAGTSPSSQHSVFKNILPALFKRTSSLCAGVTRERNKTCKMFYKDIF